MWACAARKRPSRVVETLDPDRFIAVLLAAPWVTTSGSFSESGGGTVIGTAEVAGIAREIPCARTCGTVTVEDGSGAPAVSDRAATVDSATEDATASVAAIVDTPPIAITVRASISDLPDRAVPATLIYRRAFP